MEKGRIFISYSRVNAEFALRLAKDLKSSGINIWIDQMDIPTGARWDDALEKALEDCSIFLILLSPESTGSQNVKDEIGYAIDTNKRILPVIVKPCTVPLRLRRFQYVDFTTKSYEESLNDMKVLIGSGYESSDTMATTESMRGNPTMSSMLGSGQINHSTKIGRTRPSSVIAVAMGLVLVAVVGIIFFMVGRTNSLALAQGKPTAEILASPTIALSYKNHLSSNKKPFLYPTETLTSEDGRYQLALHDDGNLVLKDKGNPIWNSETAGNYDVLYLQMQEDGNLVIYAKNLRVIWSSETLVKNPASEYILLVQNDGNVVILTAAGETLWALK